MKKKKLDKKLVLNKKTLANLDNHQLQVLRGGAPPTQRETQCPRTCLTCNWECL